MRKLVIITLTILAFFVCLFLGLQAAGILPGDLIKELTGISKESSFSSSPLQHNLLVLHVDDLQAETPKLVSVWGLIVYYPDPKLIFQPLYPLPDTNGMDYPGTFKLREDKTLSPEFIKAVGDYNQIHWDDYIMADDAAYVQLHQFITNEENPAISQQPEIQIAAEQKMISKLCDVLVQKQTEFLLPIRWSLLIPDHLQTSLDLDRTLAKWDILTHGEKPLNCMVFGD